MKTETFKRILSENKEVLRGRTLTIFVGSSEWDETFTTLKEFGKRILELEESGYEFSFEDSLIQVRALFKNTPYNPTIKEMTEEIKRFGTAA